RQPIDLPRALQQHAAYERWLEARGARVVRADPEPELPDAVFVEDAALVLDELAVITRPGAASRRPETPSVERALAPYRPLRRLEPPATLDGGDVLRIGRTLYVGLGGRTNPEGVAQLAAILAPRGYRVQGVPVRGCLHLKSACSFLGRDTLLVNPDWVDPAVFGDLRLLHPARGEPNAAATLRVGDAILLPSAFPATRTLLEAHGFAVSALDLSELRKAEAGPTCCSILFEAHESLASGVPPAAPPA